MWPGMHLGRSGQSLMPVVISSGPAQHSLGAQVSPPFLFQSFLLECGLFRSTAVSLRDG